MRMSIVGLGFSGKTTFFQILTQHGQEGSVSGKKGSNIGTLYVPDPRLDRLTEVYKPKRQVNASMEFLDTPSLSVAGAGKSFTGAALDEVRRADTLCLVIQAFNSPSAPHPTGTVDGVRDLEFINSEFILLDLGTLEKRAEKLRKLTRINKQAAEVRELETVEKALEHLVEEQPLRDVDLSEQELLALAPYQLLTLKPVLVVLNIDDDQVADMDAVIAPYREHFPGAPITAMCATLEAELAEMEPEDAGEFMAELGISEAALDRIVAACFGLLGMQVFFTVGEDECRAWTIAHGDSAFVAAGKIHSDIQRGFIRAMVLPYAAFDADPATATFKNRAAQQRKDYAMQDGDLVEFLFNV
jgi:GTP-binding protein YchF